MTDVQVREVSPGLWSCYWTDGGGTLQAVVESEVTPDVEVVADHGLHVMRLKGSQAGWTAEGAGALAVQGRDRSDAELGVIGHDH